ncbi:MAG: dTDP-4-keto-6-deoxy-D-glucose epimerase [Telmatospirillum sp.]|nr:dTDP-4-keto-6-deoxy-D-glucose epimerase [Telmatospirillum sp.]
MSRFSFRETPLDGLVVVLPQTLTDSRGGLTRLFCADELSSMGWTKPIAQINRTRTEKSGTVRGFHFQAPPSAEAKLISCFKGAVWDVAVDLRADSPTFLQWHAVELTEDNGEILLVPEGFAHGFQTLVDDCRLLYFHSAAYDAACESGVDVRDPALRVDWPLPISNLSDRDANHPALTPDFRGISL